MSRGDLETDIASIVIRIEQINAQKQPEHWLWDRVMECDIKRLRDYLSDETKEHIDSILIRMKNMANSETPTT